MPSLSFNRSMYDLTSSTETAFKARKLYNDIATATDKNTQFSDGLAAGLGVASLILQEAKYGPFSGLAILGTASAAISGINNVLTHAAQGTLSEAHVIDAVAGIVDFAAAMAKVGAALPIPQIRALAYGLNMISLAVNNADAIGYVFSPDFDNTMSHAISDINAQLSSDIDHLMHDMSDSFGFARMLVNRRDPFVLDLDGDGIETVSADGSVLFDHDGNGMRTGTGWVGSDDGLLVLDRNGNGAIDNGTELFGNDTALSGGGTAADGFAAVNDLDSNVDGVFDANDTQFSNVQVWRDLNQNGVSDSGELWP